MNNILREQILLDYIISLALHPEYAENLGAISLPIHSHLVTKLYFVKTQHHHKKVLQNHLMYHKFKTPANSEYVPVKTAIIFLFLYLS